MSQKRTQSSTQEAARCIHNRCSQFRKKNKTMKLQLFIAFTFLFIFNGNLNGQDFKYKKKIKKYVYKGADRKLDYEKQFDEVLENYSGYWEVRIDEKWGIVGYHGDLLMDVKYDKIKWNNSKEYGIVKLDGKCGVIGKGNIELIPIEFDRIDYYTSEESLLQKNGKWNLLKNGAIEEVTEEIIFRNPDEKPILKECEGKEKDCTEKTMLMKIYKNIKYPEEALNNGIEGSVVCEIIISKDGGIEEVNVLKGIGGGCDKEAIRVIKTHANDWISGKQDGLNVKTKYNMPIRYRLE
jgi:TonB family protein